MSWYSFSTSTSSVGTHGYATRHAAAPLWDFCVPCGHISPRRPFSRLWPVLGGNYAAHYQAVTAAQSQGPGGVGSVGYVEVAGHECGVVLLLFVMRDKVGGKITCRCNVPRLELQAP